MCNLLVVLLVGSRSVLAESVDGVLEDDANGHVLLLEINEVLLLQLPVVQPFLHLSNEVQNAFGFEFIEF